MAAPGWYPDETHPGHLRLRDGATWTENHHPVQQAPSPPAAPAPPPPPTSSGSTVPLGPLGGCAAVSGAIAALVSCVLPVVEWYSIPSSERDAHKWLVAAVAPARKAG